MPLIVARGNDSHVLRLPDVDEMKVIQACRLLRAVLRVDPEVCRIVLHVQRDSVLVTTFSKDSQAGTQLIVDQDLIADGVRSLEDRR
jgi:hypothetical protein